VRVQTLNTLRDLFGTRLPGDSPGWSLRRAMQRVAEEGCGVVVLINEEESTEQMMEDVLQFPLVPKPVSVGVEEGTRIYRLIGTGAQILKQIGVGKMRALSAPTRFNALSGFNLEVTEFIED
jgi:3,4-dihydroxy 2-butanone 4-phosphate synthase/GTP cyclohydrolase II